MNPTSVARLGGTARPTGPQLIAAPSRNYRRIAFISLDDPHGQPSSAADLRLRIASRYAARGIAGPRRRDACCHAHGDAVLREPHWGGHRRTPTVRVGGTSELVQPVVRSGDQAGPDDPGCSSVDHAPVVDAVVGAQLGVSKLEVADPACGPGSRGSRTPPYAPRTTTGRTASPARPRLSTSQPRPYRRGPHRQAGCRSSPFPFEANPTARSKNLRLIGRRTDLPAKLDQDSQ